MAEQFVLCNKSDLDSVANAIREKSGSAEGLVFPQDFVSNVNSIETGGAKFDVIGLTLNFDTNGLDDLIIDGVFCDANGNYTRNSLSYANGDYNTGDTIYVMAKSPLIWYIYGGTFGSDMYFNNIQFTNDANHATIYGCDAYGAVYESDTVTVIWGTNGGW